MEPFGPENPRPVFVTRNVTDPGYSRIVKDSHVRFVLRKDNQTFTGIGFNLAKKFSLIQKNVPLDIVYTIDVNEWNGEQTLQLKIVDFNVSQIN
jgi:single-stranded-DNA-specific exonuclease